MGKERGWKVDKLTSQKIRLFCTREYPKIRLFEAMLEGGQFDYLSSPSQNNRFWSNNILGTLSTEILLTFG